MHSGTKFRAGYATDDQTSDSAHKETIRRNKKDGGMSLLKTFFSNLDQLQTH